MKQAALIHSNATPAARRFLTRWVFGIWFLIILTDPFTDLAYLPQGIFHPTGILTIPFAHGYFTAPALWALKAGLLIFLLAAFFEFQFLMTSCLASILLVMHQGLIRGFGHISHGEIVLLLAACLLSLLAVADAIVRRKKRPAFSNVNIDSVPFIGILAVMCFTYSFAGIHRLVYSGPGSFFSDAILNHVLINSLTTDTWPFRLHDAVLSNGWASTLFKAGFPVLTLFEILAPLCLVSRPFRYSFVAVMFPFHILSWIFLGVFFWETLVLYMLFFDYSRGTREYPLA